MTPTSKIRLREWRATKGLSLRDLEHQLRGKPSRGLLSLYERGERQPNMNTLTRIAAALGITLGELFTGPPARTSGRRTRRTR